MKCSTGTWKADQAVNNLFDLEAANNVYQHCIAVGIPLRVVSRHAVPNISMSIAKDLATQFPEDALMQYLVSCQVVNTISEIDSVER